MKEKLTNLMIVDGNTGEVVQYLTQSEEKYLKTHFTSAPKTNKTGCEVRPSTDTFHQYIKETCGSFYFNYYNSNPNGEQYIFRFLYLCTFMNYTGYIEYCKEPITRKDLEDMLELKRTETHHTINWLEENNMIQYDKNGYIFINNDVCNRGKMLHKNKEVIRMFDDAIRELYENSKPTEHKKLSLLIKILPLVNFSTNMICKNPTEENVTLIERYSLKELAEYLGYSKASSLKRAILDSRVNGERVAIISIIDKKDDVVVINPRIYYKGTHLESMEGLVNLFRVK